MFAALLAGRSLLLHDGKPPDEPELFNALSSRLRNVFAEDIESSDGQSCLRHMYDTPCDSLRDGRRLTIGQIIARERQSPGTFNTELDSLGLRLMSDGSLFVPHRNGQLERVYYGKAWAGGWKHSMQRLPGVKSAPYPVRVSGSKIRGLLIPPDLLPSLDADAEADPPRPP